MMPDPKLLSRFMSKINFDGPTAEHMDSPCWIWTAATRTSNRGGGRRGRFRIGDRTHLAHRAAYELIVRPIPDGMVIDHACANSLCVNPAHLEPVTNKVNMERRTKGATVNSTTGVRGVSWDKRRGKYKVRVEHNGVEHFGGYFTDLAEAEQAAIALRERLFGADEKRREFIVADERELLAVSA